jgi:hypothetical protein
VKHLVLATREGLIGEETASGYRIDRVVRFVALPCELALHSFIRITNPLTGNTTLAQVLDIGPWSEKDNAYVMGDARPLSESGRKVDRLGVEISGKTNGAGIDLGEAVWNALGMLDNGKVWWEFAT